MNKQAFSALARSIAAEHGVESLAAMVSTETRTVRALVGCKPPERFHVASITKPVTAAVALDVIGPDLAIGAWPGVTCGDLLGHMSGYQCEYGDLARFGDGADALQRASRSLQSLEPLVAPRTVWSYSNAGYWLAAAFAADGFGAKSAAGAGSGAGLGAERGGQPGRGPGNRRSGLVASGCRSPAVDGARGRQGG